MTSDDLPPTGWEKVLVWVVLLVVCWALVFLLAWGLVEVVTWLTRD